MKNLKLHTTALTLALGIAGLAGTAQAGTKKMNRAEMARQDIKKTFGFLPAFMKSISDDVLPGAWTSFKAISMNPNTALPQKTKELIGLAVASQIPCEYCTFAHTEFAKLAGASEGEISEAIGAAGLTRLFSTYFNGTAMDLTSFKAEVDKLLAAAKNHKKSGAPIEVVDAASARQQMRQSFGFVPSFMAGVPDQALPGLWIQLRDLQLAKTSLPSKDKSLIGLAVAAQVPCAYCVAADTAFAKAAGATDVEVKEAVLVASTVRQWSALLNGHQADKPQFKKDIRRLVANFSRHASK